MKTDSEECPKCRAAGAYCGHRLPGEATGPRSPGRCEHCGGPHSVGGAIRHHSEDCPVLARLRSEPPTEAGEQEPTVRVSYAADDDARTVSVYGGGYVVDIAVERDLSGGYVLTRPDGPPKGHDFAASPPPSGEPTEAETWPKCGEVSNQGLRCRLPT